MHSSILTKTKSNLAKSLFELLLTFVSTKNRNNEISINYGSQQRHWPGNGKTTFKKGLFVYLGSRDLEKGNEVVKELADNGFENIKAIEIDVTKPHTILAAKSIVENEQGKLDVLINNAGIFGGYSQSAINVSIDQFKEVYETNVYGVVSVSQAFIDLLRKSPEPRIVNVSTSVGSLTLQSDPDWPSYQYVKYAAYSSSKAALNMYTNITLRIRNNTSKMQINTTLITEIKLILSASRQKAVKAVDIERVLMYWQIGKKIFEEEQQGKETATKVLFTHTFY